MAENIPNEQVPSYIKTDTDNPAVKTTYSQPAPQVSEKQNQRWFVVDDDGEFVTTKRPTRSEYGFWTGLQGTRLETGTIERITGKRLAWEDEPLEWWDGKEKEEKERGITITYVNTPQPAPQDLRSLLEKHFGFDGGTDDKWYLRSSVKYYLESGRILDTFLRAFKDFASDVSAEDKKRIAELETSLAASERLRAEDGLNAARRIAELEEEIQNIHWDNIEAENKRDIS